jgi:hypothetical protein
VSSGPIDWFRVVTDLERSGLSLEQIGSAIGRSKTQVIAYKAIEGTEPRFGVGMLLLGLWQERCGDKVSLAPTLDD